MAFGVPVIITECPAVNGLLTDEAVVVRAGDADALADAMRRVWEDESLRRVLAERGRRYAMAHGSKERLHRDILAAAFAPQA
jgi:glycosyltransferase involved in cell wall biosynthesis